GSIAIADGVTLLANAGGQTVDNSTGGSIMRTGTGTIDIVGGTFDHGAGTIAGGTAPIQLDGSNLTIASANAGQFLWHGAGDLTGSLSAAQSLTLQGQCGLNAVATEPASFGNAGTIVLTSTVCGNLAELDGGANTITN